MEISHEFFLNTTGNSNSTSFLNDPWNFHMLFFKYPWKLHVLNSPTCLGFFWNSPMSMYVTPKNSYGANLDRLAKHNLLW